MNIIFKWLHNFFRNRYCQQHQEISVNIVAKSKIYKKSLVNTLHEMFAIRIINYVQTFLRLVCLVPVTSYSSKTTELFCYSYFITYHLNNLKLVIGTDRFAHDNNHYKNLLKIKSTQQVSIKKKVWKCYKYLRKSSLLQKLNKSFKFDIL